MSQNPQESYVYSDVNGAGVVRRKVAIIGAGPVSFVLLSTTKKWEKFWLDVGLILLLLSRRD